MQLIRHLTAYTSSDVEIGKVELPIGESYKEFVNEMILDEKNGNRYSLSLAINMGDTHSTIQNKLNED